MSNGLFGRKEFNLNLFPSTHAKKKKNQIRACEFFYLVDFLYLY